MIGVMDSVDDEPPGKRRMGTAISPVHRLGEALKQIEIAREKAGTDVDEELQAAERELQSARSKLGADE